MKESSILKIMIAEIIMDVGWMDDKDLERKFLEQMDAVWYENKKSDAKFLYENNLG